MAGLLQVVGGSPFAFGVAPDRLVGIWGLLCWPAGGVILLIASFLLAGSGRQPGLIGRGRLRRLAVILSGSGPLLLVLAFGLSWTTAAAPLLVAVQLLSAAGTLGVAAALPRSDSRVAAVRAGFVLIALLDAVGLVLVALPNASPAAQFVIAFLRPVAVALTGLLLCASRRRS
ncbi:hypothetical protein [Amnibacterium kyonggiense]|uniref:hypothetical protein n=1 Tax=Amnibacterium kyonggiense TaxID=595671 RepID=UPI00105F1710|nr:hypothetical protein [Amnibacterium kyonggiense]